MPMRNSMLTAAVLAVVIFSGADGGSWPRPDRSSQPVIRIASAAAEEPPPRPVAPVDVAGFRLEAEIVGPVGGKIEAGRPVRLKAAVKVTRDAATTVLMEAAGDDIPTAYEWQLANPPDGYKLSDWTDSDGRSVIFSDPRPGEYRFVLSVAKWLGGNKPLLRSVSYTLTCVGPDQPIPPPKVDPPKADPPVVDPPVQPPAPQPTEFTRLVRDKVQELVPEAARGPAVGLAQSYAGNSLLIESGAWTVADAKSGKQRDANAAVLGDKAAAWRPFLNWLVQELGRQETAGNLATPAAVAKKWAEISAGLLIGSVTSPQ